MTETKSADTPVAAEAGCAQPDRRVHAALLCIVVLGAALRLYGLGDRSIWFDEGASYMLSEYAGFNFDLLQREINVEAAGFLALVRAWRALIEPLGLFPRVSYGADFMLRLLPCLFSIAVVPLLFLFARRIGFDAQAALIAAFLCAISPFQIFYAQELRVYSCYLFLALLAAGALYRLFAPGPGARDWCCLVLLEIALVWSHFFAVWAVFSFNVFFLVMLRKHLGLFWKWCAAQAIVVAAVLPPLFIARNYDKSMAAVAEASNGVSWFSIPSLKTAFITYKTFFAGYGFRPWAYHALLLLAIILTALGLHALRKRPKELALLAVLAFVPMAGAALVWRFGAYSYYQHRLFIFSAALAYLMVARGIRALGAPPLMLGACAIFAALTAPLLADHYAHRLHPVEAHLGGVKEKVDFRGPAAYIEEHWEEGDLLAHSGLYTYPPMRRYLDVPQKHIGATDYDLELYVKHTGNTGVWLFHGAFPVLGDIAVKGAKRVWLIEAYGNVFDTEPQSIPIREWLGARMTLLIEKEFDGTRLRLYEADSPKAP